MQQQQIRGLILMSGMKTPEQWRAMGFDAKGEWLADLSPIQLRAQASVLAVASRREVSAVLQAWIANGYLSGARALEALAAEPDATRGGEVQ
jgi:hypothetical protein